jgi:hypothetical protein
MPRTPIALTLALLVSLFGTLPASARGGVSGTSGPSGAIEATVDAVIAGRAGPGSDGCVWERMDQANPIFPGHDQIVDQETGRVSLLWWRTCPDGRLPVLIPLITPGVLGQHLYDQMKDQLPVPDPKLIPSGRWQIAAYPTNIWFEPAGTTDRSITASAGGISVTLTAKAGTVVFNPGNDEDPITCPGIPRTEGDCVYIYPTSSAEAPDQKFPATIQITWTFRWESSTGATGTPAPVTMRTTLQIPVARIQVIAA